MPRNPKYPLAPLREHRERSVDAATAQLADAVRARQAADDAKRRAEETRLQAEERAAAVRRAETERLASGELRVADLARAQAWEHVAVAEIADLGRAIARADDTVIAARANEGQARAAVAQTKADRDVVAKDEARFDAGVRRARDAAEEDAADEVFAARRRDA